MYRNAIAYLSEAAKREGKKVAITQEDKKITYEDLLEKVQSFALEIYRFNIHKGLVVILGKKSIFTVISLWGVIFSGNFYTCIDSDIPVERILDMLKSVDPDVVLYDNKTEKVAEKLKQFGYSKTVFINFSKIELIKVEKRDIEVLSTIENSILETDPLYLVFTSGTTGKPKGVIKSHHSLVSFIEEFVNLFKFSSEEIFGNQAPFDFDVAAKDIFTSVRVGATLCLIPANYFMQPSALVSFLNNYQITTLIWSASAVKFIALTGTLQLKETPKYIKKVLFSGEKLAINVLKAWQEKIPEALYVSLYAPTEVTGNCLYYIVEDTDLLENLPLGKCFDNMEVIILNDKMKLAQENEIGEIYVRGPFLATGYYKNLQKTNEVFVQNPLHNAYKDIVYKTGDLAVEKNGTLYFLSRIDNQIKYMGHRIELEEIEQEVLKFDNIKECCCTFDEKKEKIILFYSSKVESDNEILLKLREHFPSYMLPGKLVRREDFPINTHGKIDRLKLKEIIKNEQC